MIAIGLFLVISMFTNTTGAVGAAVKTFLSGLLGFISYILPFFLIVYGVLIFAQRTSYVTVSSIIAVVILFVLLTCIVANFKAPLKGVAHYDFSMSFKDVYAMGTDGGGIVGVYAGGFIKNLIGEMGLYIVGAAGVIISLLLILNTPLSSLIDNAKIKRKARKEARELAREEQQKQDEIEREKKEEERKIREEEALKAKKTEETSRAAAAATITGLKTSREVQQKVDTDNLPKLDMAPVKNFHDQSEPEKAPAEEPAPVNRFTPEDIGLKTPEKQRLVVEGITENQQKVLDMVMDDDLFGGSGSQNRPDVSAQTAAPVKEPEPEEKPVQTRQRKASEVSAEDRKKADEAVGKELQSSPKHPVSNYIYPSVELLSKGSGKSGSSLQSTQEQARLLEDTLASFGVSASVIDVVRGPAVTRFEVQPATGVKVSKIAALHDDLALNLRAKSLRIEAPIPGKAAVGIEVSNDTISTVTLREIIESQEFKQSKSKISVAIGRSIGGDSIVATLSPCRICSWQAPPVPASPSA